MSKLTKNTRQIGRPYALIQEGLDFQSWRVGNPTNKCWVKVRVLRTEKVNINFNSRSFASQAGLQSIMETQAKVEAEVKSNSKPNILWRREELLAIVNTLRLLCSCRHRSLRFRLCCGCTVCGLSRWLQLPQDTQAVLPQFAETSRSSVLRIRGIQMCLGSAAWRHRRWSLLVARIRTESTRNGYASSRCSRALTNRPCVGKPRPCLLQAASALPVVTWAPRRDNPQHRNCRISSLRPTSWLCLLRLYVQRKFPFTLRKFIVY